MNQSWKIIKNVNKIIPKCSYIKNKGLYIVVWKYSNTKYTSEATIKTSFISFDYNDNHLLNQLMSDGFIAHKEADCLQLLFHYGADRRALWESQGANRNVVTLRMPPGRGDWKPNNTCSGLIVEKQYIKSLDLYELFQSCWSLEVI